LKKIKKKNYLQHTANTQQHTFSAKGGREIKVYSQQIIERFFESLKYFLFRKKLINTHKL